jgi:hemolysin activation/secretion protein
MSLLTSFLIFQSVHAETVTFPINQFLIQGNTLLEPELLTQLTQPFTGKARVYGDIQKALEAIEYTYRRAGYGAVQVYAPEQDISTGFVRLNIIETKLGKVIVEPTQYFEAQNIIDSLPSLQQGLSPNTRDISDNIRLVNENPAKKTEVILGLGEQEGTIDAKIKVQEENPVSIIVTADNSGKPATGEHKLGTSFQHANLWGKDHVGTLAYMTSPELPADVKVFSTGYRVPFFQVNGNLDLIAAYSDSDLVVASNLQSLGNINVVGRSKILSARYTQYLPRTGEWSHRLIASLDNKLIDTQTTIGASSQNGILQVRPIGVSYNTTYASVGKMANVSVAFSKNLPDNSDGSQDRINSQLVNSNQRTEASANFTIARANADFLTLISDSQWQLRLVANMQRADSALHAVEQIGLSGANSLRGMYERDLSADEGESASVEVYTPDLSAWLGNENGSLRLLTYIDSVSGSNLNPVVNSGTISKINATSAGIGVRYSYQKNLALRLDLAKVTHLSLRNANGTQNTREAELSDFTRGHASLMYKF